MRRQRSDANQTAIVARYRAHGVSVLVVSQHASVDAVVGFRGVDQLVEIKRGDLPASRRKLTADETKLHQTWRGRAIRIVESLDDVDRHVAELTGRPVVGDRWALDNCS